MSKQREKIAIAQGGDDIALILKRYGKIRVRPLGLFEVVELKGRKRFDFVTKKMKLTRTTKIITFKASIPLKEFIKGKRRRI